MAIPINPNDVQDFDLPLNTNPMYSVTHVFSTNDITGTFAGLTQGTSTPLAPVVDFSAAPMLTKEGVDLYPINSEFGYLATDFEGAAQKQFDDGLFEEGWAGNIFINDVHAGLVISDAPTDTFNTPATLGTWLSGLGGNTVKASTEHYTVMQDILSDQRFPEDPDAVYQLDDNLIMIGGDYDGYAVKDLIQGIEVDGIGFVKIQDKNGDGTVDIRDILEPNETTIDSNIAASTDYSVTMKDDGKLLYRWGNEIKKPNDVRLEAQLDLPDEWMEDDDAQGVRSLYRITQAELVVHHTITNNPNDQIRPEDLENESAIGTLPTYEILGDGKWVTTEGYYAGDGSYYPAGTVLKDPANVSNLEGTTLEITGATSSDLAEGFTKAWYTTMNREPFEAVIVDGEYEVGPRWRLLTDKYGQDLPSVVMPIDPSATSNPTKDEVKYEVGSETQTVINLLDWENNVSPMSLSAGWQNDAGNVSINGVNMSADFDLAMYIKGDIKPATLYSAELVMGYEEVAVNANGSDISGTGDSDYLVGMGNNTFAGGAGADLFVLSYGTTANGLVTESTVSDFEVGADTLGLIGLGVTEANFRYVVTQEVIGDDLAVSVDGELIATLSGVNGELSYDSFFATNPGSDRASDGIIGTANTDTLIGTFIDDHISGLDGHDLLKGRAGDDLLVGGGGLDRLMGGHGNDVFIFEEGTTLDIVYDFDDRVDKIWLTGVTEADFATSVEITDYRGTSAQITVGDDRMIVRGTAADDLQVDDFIFADSLAIV